jgi:hypothetical protein
MVRRRHLALVIAMLGSACGPPRLGDDSGGTDGGTDGDEVAESTESTDTSASTETETTDSTSETSGGPVCGDGIVDPGEACDLGPANAWELADCQPDCTLNECGDGLVGLGECESPLCVSDCPPTFCGNQVYWCGDLIDNDRDGLIDLYDPDCLGPCDDSEDSLAPQLPGSDLRCSQDCFFDSNSGMGDDKCEWDLQCDPQSPGEPVGCVYDPIFAMQEFSCPST